LRGKEDQLSLEERNLARNLITLIDQVFEKVGNAPDDGPTKVYRGIRKYSKKFTSGLQLAYTSTTLDSYVAWSAYGMAGAVVEIDITDVPWVNLAPYSTYNEDNPYGINEREVLLPRNIWLEVIAVKEKNDPSNPFYDTKFVQCKAWTSGEGWGIEV
jgi:hypothetical protein